MKMKEVIAIAKKWDISFKIGMSKEKLIHAIQIKEGYQPCFRKKNVCEEKNCLWMDDCISVVKVENFPFACPVCCHKTDYPLAEMVEGAIIICSFCTVRLNLHGHMLEDVRKEIKKLKG